ncbi:kinase-like protein [Coccomyxa subellipsoidea C-169]|uniref:Kinase-like protein n=1 Tax=Coccomyxa subellipsoidea (strain C-169) TaxID=574566 RepID=I0Z9N5_COCSC|nr:kinase-like protein [Coccomyxa subellipsoidea C-169]EIE27354.1 kinase-like protein [Coccomyxa subellipsoidea C-169]|eukprot:XP_005651898.1 kinase-like protein [Coccomyxa subellipsoidea C-169]
MRSDLHYQVSLGQLLGEGMFGRTFLGMWRGGDVAVKTVRVGKESEASSFLREVASLAAIRHPNVMQFFGACLQPPEQCWLLCEYLPGGNLTQWLHGDRKQGQVRRSLEERVRMALGVAQGMQALEAAEPPILHRDLKPSNVFLDVSGRPCVADMGLARRLTPASAACLTGETGTYVYMAPEMIRHELYTSKADVFSWGVLLAEVLSQRPPYEGLYMTPVQVALAVGDNELRPTLPSDTPEPLLNVALACYNPEPENRPSFALIVHHMRKVSSAGLPYVTISSF